MNKKTKLAELYQTYATSVRRLAGRLVSQDDIDDIVQETFVRSYEAELKQEIRYPKSYMLKTAKHLALNHLDKWDNKFKQSLLDDLDAPEEMLSEQLESQCESKERFLLFCEAAGQLSGAVRKTFILKKVYGFSQKEIAQCLTLSESTVEKHVATGLLKCAEFMQSREKAQVTTKEMHSPSSLNKGRHSQ